MLFFFVAFTVNNFYLNQRSLSYYTYMYLPARQLVKKLGITSQTLRTWAESGKIKCIKTEGGHRRYLVEEEHGDPARKKVIYARVSSKKQQKSLKNQVNFLLQKYPDYEVFQDIGSGINYQRPGFRSVLELLFAGNLEECVVTSGDRFARYGDFFEWLFTKFGAKFTSVSAADSRTELTDDLMEIITVFSARYYGRESHKSHEEGEDLPDKKTKRVIRKVPRDS